MRRDLAPSRAVAREAIAAGLVTVDGAPATKPATQVAAGQALHLTASPRAYVSRGGEKLAHALDRFGVDPAGRRCLDAGVSTGGFTDVLRRRGAAHVDAYDVGYGQVHERIRTDEGVTVHERTNVRHLTAEDVTLPAPDLVVVDVSFISLTVVLGALRAVAADDAEAVVLVKPQFEAGRGEVGRGGVVRDPQVWRRCLDDVAQAAAALDWRCAAATASPLTGPAGNVEFLLHLTPGGPVASSPAPAGSGGAGEAHDVGGRALEPAVAARLDAAVAEGVALVASTAVKGDA